MYSCSATWREGEREERVQIEIKSESTGESWGGEIRYRHRGRGNKTIHNRFGTGGTGGLEIV